MLQGDPPGHVPLCAPLRAGGVFYGTAVHDVDVVSTLLGERTPHTVFALGSALCPGEVRPPGVLPPPSC